MTPRDEYLAYLLEANKRLEEWFSNIRNRAYAITSDLAPGYNCIAWAVGCTDAWWWPADPRARGVYWPPGVPREVTISAFIQAFATVGFSPCDDGAPEHGFEKLALYAKATTPTHAARQLDDGQWTSKVGRWEDITHTLSALTGDGKEEYGAIVKYMKRPKP